MANDFDLSEPNADPDVELARKLLRASQRRRDEKPIIYIDHDHPATESAMAIASQALGQTIWRRPA